MKILIKTRKIIQGILQGNQKNSCKNSLWSI